MEVGNKQNYRCNIYSCKFGVFSVVIQGLLGRISAFGGPFRGLRRFSLVWCLSWLLNSAFKMYPVAFVNDLLCTISTVVALVRYRDKGNKTDKNVNNGLIG